MSLLRGKKKRHVPPTLLWIFTSSGFHASSLWEMLLCWQMLNAVLPPPSPLSLLICRTTDEDSVASIGKRKEKSAEPPWLNNAPNILPSCNLSQSLEEIFSLLVTDLVLDFILAAGCKVGYLLYYLSFHPCGLMKDSQHRRHSVVD